MFRDYLILSKRTNLIFANEKPCQVVDLIFIYIFATSSPRLNPRAHPSRPPSPIIIYDFLKQTSISFPFIFFPSKQANTKTSFSRENYFHSLSMDSPAQRRLKSIQSHILSSTTADQSDLQANLTSSSQFVHRNLSLLMHSYTYTCL